MDFSFNDDHLALRDAVQRFCDGEYPAEHRGNPETPEQARQRWAGMAELGLLGLPMAAEVGGSEQGPVEVLLVAQELGRALGGGAFVASTVVAGDVLARLGSPAQQQAYLSRMATGELQAALALNEEGLRYDWDRLGTTLTRTPQGLVLNGVKTLVLHGDTAGLWLVVARDATPGREGLAVVAVNAGMSGVRVQGFDTLDGRRAARIVFDQVAVADDAVLGAAGAAADVSAAVEAALDAGIAALCAESVGAIEALLSHTAEHMRTRKQFGAPLAKFQVLQHRVADWAIALEQIKSMACAAAMAVQAGDATQRRRLVSAAKVLVSQQGRKIGLEAIQTHGAMGMTDECRVGHYAKRLIAIGQLWGDAAWHLARLSARA